MPKSGPIIIVEDDSDDQDLLREVFEELKVPNLLRFFASSMEALHYLLTTIENPFLIICDINLPSMNGFDLKLTINENEQLRRKNIPFIFLSTNSEKTAIAKAFEVLAQGYFIKPVKLTDIRDMVLTIVHYWKICGRVVD